MLYLLLFIACIGLLVSNKINTDNLLKLTGIGFIAVGCIVEMAKGNSILVEIGILMYFCANIASAYFGIRKRRYYDKKVAQ